MRLFARAFGLVLLLLTSGCLVETETTLGEPDPKSVDEKLIGNWYSAEGGEVVVFAVAPDKERPGALNVVFASIRADTEKLVEQERYRVWRTVVAGHSYLNVVRLGGTGDTPKTLLAAYDLGADGTLVLRLMDTKAVADAIAAGKLKGTVKKGQYADDVKITAPRTELLAFLAGAKRDELFSAKTGTLRRLPDTGK